MTVLQLAFWSLGVGILLGAWWADLVGPLVGR
jgi:hypothetical protein